MKTLIYGAGVLGSYLAYTLAQAGNEVSILARGRWLETLKNDGLVIRHSLQLRRTVTRPRLVESLGPEDHYDAVFCVMQKTQLPAILPALAANRASSLFVLVGNDGEAPETEESFRRLRGDCPATLLFGFLGAAGRREGGEVKCFHRGKSSLVLGSLSGDEAAVDRVAAMLKGSRSGVYRVSRIDAWLKQHLAIVVPVCLSIHWAKGDLRRLASDDAMLDLSLDAIRECIAALEAGGFHLDPPADGGLLARPNSRIRPFLKLIYRTPAGRLMAGDHAMRAITEMAELARELDALIERSGREAPAYRRLRPFLIEPERSAVFS